MQSRNANWVETGMHILDIDEHPQQLQVVPCGCKCLRGKAILVFVRSDRHPCHLRLRSGDGELRPIQLCTLIS